jgi:hypothetical protein
MRLLSGIVAALIAAVIVMSTRFDAGALGTSESVAPAMIGTWSGIARIVVNWTEQKKLPARVTITQDGTVTGAVGDATLRDGRLHRNRTAIGRALNVKTDWIIEGKLEGPIIKPEGIQRDSVKLPLNWIGDHYEGGVNTSGSQFGGKTSMRLAAQHLRLDRGPVK